MYDPPGRIYAEFTRSIFKFIPGDNDRFSGSIRPDRKLANLAQNLIVLNIDPNSPTQSWSRILDMSQIEIILEYRGTSRLFRNTDQICIFRLCIPNSPGF